MLSHGGLDLSYFFFLMAGPRAVWICCTYRWPKSPRKVICHGFWRDVFVYLQAHLLMQAIATANKQLLSVVMWDNELTSPWSNHFRMLVSSPPTDLRGRHLPTAPKWAIVDGKSVENLAAVETTIAHAQNLYWTSTFLQFSTEGKNQRLVNFCGEASDD